MKPYISFSEIDLWYRDRARYVRTYVDGVSDPPTPGQQVGTIFHAVVADPKYPWLEELRKLKYSHRQIFPIRKAIDKIEGKRAPEREVVYRATTRDGLKILCVFDGFAKAERGLWEYKTSLEGTDRWTQFSVDRNRQISFYAWTLWLKTHHFFRDIHLYYADLRKGNVKHFETARGIKDILFIQDWAYQAVKEIKAAGLWEKRLSRQEALIKNSNQALKLK